MGGGGGLGYKNQKTSGYHYALLGFLNTSYQTQHQYNHDDEHETSTRSTKAMQRQSTLIGLPDAIKFQCCVSNLHKPKYRSSTQISPRYCSLIAMI